MKKTIVLIGLIMLTCSFASYAATKNKALPTHHSKYQIAKKAIHKYFNCFTNKNRAGLKKLLSRSFQEVEASRVYDYNAELASVKTTTIGKFKIGNFKVTKSKNVLIATYTVLATNEIIAGKKVLEKPFYRLTIIQKIGKKWLLLAHANLALKES